MDSQDHETRKRKALEAIGCSLYIIAILVMGAVFVSKCGEILK